MVRAASDALRYDADVRLPARALGGLILAIISGTVAAVWWFAAFTAELRQGQADTRRDLSDLKAAVAAQQATSWSVDDQRDWAGRLARNAAPTNPPLIIPSVGDVVRDRTPTTR